MSKYPVDATWEGKELDHPDISGEIINQDRIATIWLSRRTGDFEMWMYRWEYSDGSSLGFNFDWGTSYRSVKDQLPFPCRMRRIR